MRGLYHKVTSITNLYLRMDFTARRLVLSEMVTNVRCQTVIIGPALSADQRFSSVRTLTKSICRSPVPGPKATPRKG